ncbi:MAG: TetR/AcrR family transcriptional regulator, partial [Myxococcota bacterium]
KDDGTARFILEAAEQLARAGKSLTIRSVVQRAGVSVGAFYYHFKNQDALLRALVDKLMEESGTYLLDAWAKRPEEILEDACSAYARSVVAFYLESPALMRLACRTIVSMGAEESAVEARERFLQQLADSVDEPVVQHPEFVERMRVLVDMLFGIVLAELARARPRSGERAGALVDRLVRAEIGLLREELAECG